MMELMNEITSFEPGSEEEKAVFRFAIEQLLLLLRRFLPILPKNCGRLLGISQASLNSPGRYGMKRLLKKSR